MYVYTHIGKADMYVYTHIGFRLMYVYTHIGSRFMYVYTHIGKADTQIKRVYMIVIHIQRYNI